MQVGVADASGACFFGVTLCACMGQAQLGAMCMWPIRFVCPTPPPAGLEAAIFGCPLGYGGYIMIACARQIEAGLAGELHITHAPPPRKRHAHPGRPNRPFWTVGRRRPRTQMHTSTKPHRCLPGWAGLLLGPDSNPRATATCRGAMPPFRRCVVVHTMNHVRVYEAT